MNRFAAVTLSLGILSGCSVVSSATKSGMKPILMNGIEGFLLEPDLEVAEVALVANMKLIEGVVETYPDDRQLTELAAMARANYAFAFIQDQLEAAKLAYPSDDALAAQLLARAVTSYRIARGYAERALLLRRGWRKAIANRPLEQIPMKDLQGALATLERDDALALYWLAFAWGGSLQVALDPAEATSLPKVEAITARVLELNETVFYGVGPHLLAGVFHGFRAPAIGGNPEKARQHFTRAKALGGILLADVLRTQYVDAQIEDQENFESTLAAVIAAKPRPDRALFEALAKRKACRLITNIDLYFLTDSKPVPDACKSISRKYPLRAKP